MSCAAVTGSVCVAQGEDWADSLSVLNPDGTPANVTGWVVTGGLYPAQNGAPTPGGAQLLNVAGYVTLTSATVAPQWAILVPRAALAAALAAAGGYWLQLFADDAAGVRQLYVATTFNYDPSGGF